MANRPFIHPFTHPCIHLSLSLCLSLQLPLSLFLSIPLSLSILSLYRVILLPIYLMLLDIYGCKDNEIENWLKWENGYELTKTGTSWLGRYELTKNGYELTKKGTSWLDTSWPVTILQLPYHPKIIPPQTGCYPKDRKNIQMLISLLPNSNIYLM